MSEMVQWLNRKGPLPTAREAIACLDRFAHTTRQDEATWYMQAYHILYGVDSAPYWVRTYPETLNDGVEQTQAAAQH